MRRLLAAIGLAATAVLPGCGWLQGDPVNPPAELVDFEPSVPVERIWSTSVGADAGDVPLHLGPAFANGLIYTADRKGRIKIIEPDNGNVQDSFDTDLPLSAGPAVDGGMIMVGTLEGEVFVFDIDSGQVKWRAPVSSEVLADPVLHNGVVAVRCNDGRVFGFDAESGKRLWLYDKGVPLLSLRGNSDPLARGGLVFIGYDNGDVVALRARDGNVAWEQSVAGPGGGTALERMADIDGQMALIANNLYVTSYDGRLSALSADNGRVLWVQEVGSARGLDVQRTHISIGDRNDYVWLIDRRNASTLWKQDRLEYRGLTRPELYLDYVAVGDFEGYLHFIDRDSGDFVARTQVDSSGFSAAPVSRGVTLYVLDRDGTLSAYRAGPAL